MRILAVFMLLTLFAATPSCRSVAEEPAPDPTACRDCTREPYWTWKRFEEGSHHAPASRAVRRFRCVGCGVDAAIVGDEKTAER